MLIKHKIKLVGVMLSLSMSTAAFAEELSDDFIEDIEFEPVLALRGSVNWVNVSDNDVDSVGLGDDKYIRDNDETNAGWGAFAGAEWEVAESWLFLAGISYDILDRTNIEGNIHLQGDSNLDDLDYQYKLLHQRLDGEFKLYKRWKGWYPYLAASLGVAWNKTSDYEETTDDPATPALDILEGQDTTDFTWGVGAGLERVLFEDWRLGLGYMYTDAGTAQLKSKETGDTLEQRFSTQQLILQINYIFD